MKKSIFAFALLCCFVCTQRLHAQAFGMSGSVVGFFPKFKDVTYSSSYYSSTVRTLGHVTAFSPGIRIEGNYILPGFNFPISGYNGIGFTYFFPLMDSAFYMARTKNGYSVDVLGKSKTTNYNISLRFAYEIPQTFNDFLLLHIGWGMGYMHSKTEYILPDKSPTFNYDKSDFDETSFIPTKHGGIAVEVLAGGIYELEHFSIIGQYSVMFGFDEGLSTTIRYQHGFTLGIFYPLKKL